MIRVEDLDRCARCGGLCCNRAPGRYAPDDFTNSDSLDPLAIIRAMDEGFTALNTSFITVYGKRAAPLFTVAARGVQKPELSLCDWDMKCLRVSSTGCDLPLEKRPFECASMVPNIRISQCALPNGPTMEELWIPYQALLRNIIERRSKNNWHEELRNHIFSERDNNEYKASIQDLVDVFGLASDPQEVDQVISLWQTLD